MAASQEILREKVKRGAFSFPGYRPRHHFFILVLGSYNRRTLTTGPYRRACPARTFGATALDIEAAGFDRDSGVGILQALDAVDAVGMVAEAVRFVDDLTLAGVLMAPANRS